MSNDIKALLPPKPDESGWHFLLAADGKSTDGVYWDAGGQFWGGVETPEQLAAEGFHYLMPMPSADQLRAMVEISEKLSRYLAALEMKLAPIDSDEMVIQCDACVITAGLIRRANGDA
jgi:hypothetical protein